MKRFTLIGLLVIVFVACKKNNDTAPKDSFLGRWQLKEINGPFLKTFTALDNYYIEFTETAYKSRLPYGGLKTGSYAVEVRTHATTDACLYARPDKFELWLIYDGNRDAEFKTYMDTSNYELRLKSGCFSVDSGVEYVYVRR